VKNGMSKTDNMLSILWLLRSGKRVTAQELADNLEIPVRIVYRCIDSLCASGAPIIADSGPNGGYRLLGEFVDSPLLFDSEEQKAFVHASVFAREAGDPFTDALARAVDKLKRYTNEEQLEWINRHSSGLAVTLTPTNSKELELLKRLEEAVAHALMERRRPGEVLFKLGELSLKTYVPYFLLPYGRSLKILEPHCVQNQGRKKILVELHDFACTLRNVMFYNRATGT
jgi:biotin operon repressor